MAGLIGNQMAGSQDELAEKEPINGVGPDGAEQHEGMEGEAPEPQEEMTAESVRGQMQIPQELQAAYDKIIKAGLKVMFDKSTRAETMAFMNDSGGDPEKLATGVMSVVVSLYQQSNQTLPPNLIIPAGVELMVHASDVAKEAGMEISKEMLAEAMSSMVQQTLQKFGATPEQMQKLMGGMDSGESTPAQSGGQPMQQPGQAPQGV